MIIKDYQESLNIIIIRATRDPAMMVGLACGITQKKHMLDDFSPASAKLLKYLVTAEHDSVLEHVSYTFLISGVSRSFLAQITRHRMSSFSCGSQHYQDYRDYPGAISKDIISDDDCMYKFNNALSWMHSVYEEAIDAHDILPQEARQILPNAMTTNILWTINARSLMNFFKLRLCYRNTEEIQNFAEELLSKVLHHFPDLFVLAGPQCHLGKCMQGKMRCDKGGWQT